MVFKGVLLNYTRNPMRRVQFTLGIGTGENFNALRRLGVEALRKIPAIVSEPEPRAMIQSVGDSSVLVEFSGWLDQREADFLKTRGEAIRQGKCAIEDEGIDMPEPTYRVQLISPAGDSTFPGLSTGLSTGVSNSPAPRERKLGLAEEEQPDLSVNHDLDRQLAYERAIHEGQDLLKHSAPKE